MQYSTSPLMSPNIFYGRNNGCQEQLSLRLYAWCGDRLVCSIGMEPLLRFQMAPRSNKGFPFI